MKKKFTVAIIIFLLFCPNLFFVAVNSNKIEKNIDIETDAAPQQDVFDHKIRLLMRTAHFPSLVACIIKNDSIVWSNCYGNYNILLRRKPDLNTVYMMASISKAITATAFMQIYEEGLFELDEEVNRYLDFNLRNPKHPEVNITFRMLLAHQSSLSECDVVDNAILMYIHSNFFPKYPYPFVKEYLIPGGSLYKSSVWLNSRPGEISNYSNFNYALLEHLFNIMKNQSIQEYCKENIFEPLKMYNTSFDYTSFDRKEMATPYIHLGFFYLPIPHYNSYTAGGALRSSVEDLSHFLIAHMNGGVYGGTRILNESSVNLMHEIHYPGTPGDKHEFGFGWQYFNLSGTIVHGHGGAYPGCDSNMFTNLDENKGVIFVSNNMVQTYRKIEHLSYKTIRELLVEKALKI